MMFTHTNDLEDPFYFMDPYPSIPSPLNYYEFDGSFFQCTHDQSFVPTGTISEEPMISTSTKMELSKGDVINGIVHEVQEIGSNKKVSKRGASKGDRHSKIPTAHGLRDRRMRLSLDVARQFFKLQDMLSFDKPSKTVKWLLSQAKSAIDEVKKDKESPSTDVTKCTSSTSEGEVVESAIDEEIVNGGVQKAKGKSKRSTRKNIAVSPPVPKQVKKKAREEARERARERTHKKNQARLEGTLGLGFESGYQTQNMKISSNVTFEIEHQFQDQGFTSTNWSPLMSLNYNQADVTCQVNPIPEFQQFNGTSREPYNHLNLGQYWYY